jgi:hypothetical protein
LQIMPPAHRVDRRRYRGATREQQRQRCGDRGVAQPRRADSRPSTRLNPPSRTLSLAAAHANQHRRFRSKPNALM